MFSRENKRFTVVMIAIGAVAVVGLVGVVYLSQHDKQTATLWACVTFVLVQLLAILRGTMADVKSEVERKEIAQDVATAKDKVEEIERKTNGNLSRAIDKVGEQVRKAAQQPAPGQQMMPRTPEELTALMRTFLTTMMEDDEVCSKVADAAARKAAAHTVELAARAVVDELARSGALILPHKGQTQTGVDAPKPNAPAPKGGDALKDAT